MSSESHTSRGRLPVVGGILWSLIVASQTAFVLLVVPKFEELFISMGGPLPTATAIVVNLSHDGVLAVLLAIVDAVVFAIGIGMADRPRARFVLVPALLCVVFALVVVAVLYLPQFDGVRTLR